jgi:hypothetical protein
LLASNIPARGEHHTLALAIKQCYADYSLAGAPSTTDSKSGFDAGKARRPVHELPALASHKARLSPAFKLNLLV